MSPRRRFRRIGGAWVEIPPRRGVLAAVLAWCRKRREDEN